MANGLIREDVDIYVLPKGEGVRQMERGTELTISDLHGNAIKLLFMLIKHGIASNISDDEYNALVAIYRTPLKRLTKEKLKYFDSLLAKINFNKEVALRLIGDEVADRGNNDYFTLSILKTLHEKGVPTQIMLSNHGVEFIESYEQNRKFHSPELSQDGFSCSMENMQTLIDKGVLDKQEILAIVDKVYKPLLKVVSYSLNEDNSQITIYSHAGIDLKTIKDLAEKLNVQYKDSTAAELAKTIDDINAIFQSKFVQTNTVHTLYDRNIVFPKYIDDGYSTCPFVNHSSSTLTPFETIMWNRDYRQLINHDMHNGYNISFVHGHDSGDTRQSNVTTLNDDLGKSWNEKDNNTGEYVVFSPTKNSVSQESFVNSPLVETGLKECFANTSGTNLFSPQSRDKTPTPPFMELINKMKTKAKKFEHTEHADMHATVDKLCAAIMFYYSELLNSALDENTFRDLCLDSINEARVVLEKYTSIKQIIGNVVCAVMGVGAVYIIAGLINKAATGRFLFFYSGLVDKLDVLEKNIKDTTRLTSP